MNMVTKLSYYGLTSIFFFSIEHVAIMVVMQLPPRLHAREKNKTTHNFNVLPGNVPGWVASYPGPSLSGRAWV